MLRWTPQAPRFHTLEVDTEGNRREPGNELLRVEAVIQEHFHGQVDDPDGHPLPGEMVGHGQEPDGIVLENG
jgi:hypothetical protein